MRGSPWCGFVPRRYASRRTSAQVPQLCTGTLAGSVLRLVRDFLDQVPLVPNHNFHPSLVIYIQESKFLMGVSKVVTGDLNDMIQVTGDLLHQ